MSATGTAVRNERPEIGVGSICKSKAPEQRIYESLQPGWASHGQLDFISSSGRLGPTFGGFLAIKQSAGQLGVSHRAFGNSSFAAGKPESCFRPVEGQSFRAHARDVALRKFVAGRKRKGCSRSVRCRYAEVPGALFVPRSDCARTISRVRFCAHGLDRRSDGVPAASAGRDCRGWVRLATTVPSCPRQDNGATCEVSRPVEEALTEMLRLTLVTLTLGRGGAERVTSILASGWAAEGKKVTVLTFDRGEATAYHLHSAVQLRHLGILGASTSVIGGLSRNITRLRVLREAIRQSDPDVVISFQDRTNVLTVLATRRLGLPVVVVEQIDPALHHIGVPWEFLRRRVYPYADALVCPTSRSVTKFRQMANVRAVTIPNPVEVPAEYAVRDRCNQNSSRCELIAMGRLAAQKGFDLLLQAFSRVAVKEPSWDLTILGEGASLAALQEQAHSLGLDQRIDFAGALSDPFPRLHAADLFVFSSRFEGFGMALAEAMACGLPAISFDCPEGPADIVRDGVDGLLVPPEDVPALAAALERLMKDPEERQRLAQRAPEVRLRFGRERILALWQSLFDEIVTTRRKPTEK